MLIPMSSYAKVGLTVLPRDHSIATRCRTTKLLCDELECDGGQFVIIGLEPHLLH